MWKANQDLESRNIEQCEGAIEESDLRMKCIILRNQIGTDRIPVTEIISLKCSK